MGFRKWVTGNMLLRQPEFARRAGGSRKTISVWRSEGRTVMEGDRVELEASRDLLLSTGFAWPRAVTLEPDPLPGSATSLPETVTSLPEAVTHASAASAIPDVHDAAETLFSEDLAERARRGLLTQSEAERAKETAITFKHMLSGPRAAGGPIEIAAVEAVLFEERATPG
jgi:hypothetical protein